jgi:hypothetical protein
MNLDSYQYPGKWRRLYVRASCGQNPKMTTNVEMLRPGPFIINHWPLNFAKSIDILYGYGKG